MWRWPLVVVFFALAATLGALMWAPPLNPNRAPEPAPMLSEWTLLPMTGGPAIYTACVGVGGSNSPRATRIFALQPLASRATNGLWPGASIAAVPGC